MSRKSIIPGVSFSWKRATGITSAKQRIARATGIPTTRSGRRRKAGAAMGCFLPTMIIIFSVIVIVGCTQKKQSVIPDSALSLSTANTPTATANNIPTTTPMGFCNKLWAESSIKELRDILGINQEQETQTPTDAATEENTDDEPYTDEELKQIHQTIVLQITKTELLLVPPCLADAKEFTIETLKAFDAIYYVPEGETPPEFIDQLLVFANLSKMAEAEIQKIEDCLPVDCTP